MELARQKITAATIYLLATASIFAVITLIEPFLSDLTILIPSEFVPIILVSIAILIALLTTWGAIRYLYTRQRQRRQALISEIKKHDSDFFEYVKRQLVILETPVEESQNE